MSIVFSWFVALLFTILVMISNFPYFFFSFLFIIIHFMFKEVFNYLLGGGGALGTGKMERSLALFICIYCPHCNDAKLVDNWQSFP